MSSAEEQLHQLLGLINQITADPYSAKSSTGNGYTPTEHHDTYDFIRPDQFDLSERSVLITGASRGVGHATAVSYAKAGCSPIILAARSSLDKVKEDVIEAATKSGRPPPQILKLKLDIGDEASVKAAAEMVRSTIGSLDILVNNAGYLGEFKKIIDSDTDDWLHHWKVNIRGPFLVTKYLLPILLNTSNGLKTIVNVSSIIANMFMAGGSAYAMTKFATLRFSEILQLEHQADGLITFSYHPGGIDTELGRHLPESVQLALVDTPELAGDTMVWLTAKRREWLAGRYISANWDMCELERLSPEIVANNELKVRMRVGGPPDERRDSHTAETVAAINNK